MRQMLVWYAKKRKWHSEWDYTWSMGIVLYASTCNTVCSGKALIHSRTYKLTHTYTLTLTKHYYMYIHTPYHIILLSTILHVYTCNNIMLHLFYSYICCKCVQCHYRLTTASKSNSTTPLSWVRLSVLRMIGPGSCKQHNSTWMSLV
jgi:hypothetical protein